MVGRLNDARKIWLSENADDAKKEAANIVIGKTYNQLVNQLLGELGREYGSDLLKTLPARIAKGVVREGTGIINTVFDLLAGHEDQLLRDDLDRQQARLNNLRNYWTKKLRGEPTSETPSYPEGYQDVNPSILEFQRAMSQIEARVTTPADAVRHGDARIGAEATNGYAQANVVIVNNTDQWLTLNFRGAYLIPSDGSSGAQRLGLRSPARDTTSSISRPEPPIRLASLELVAAPIRSVNSPAAYSRRGWVLVAPRAWVTIPFHGMCLDHHRGVPRPNERYYLADRPLPPRLQRILFAASLSRRVPQERIWDVIGQEGIRWYDPREDFGTMQITFVADNVARAFRLGASVWVDGKQALDHQDQDMRDKRFAVRLASGTHLVEILPNCTEGKGLLMERRKMSVEVHIEYGKTSSFLALIHLTPGFPSTTVSVSSFTRQAQEAEP